MHRIGNKPVLCIFLAQLLMKNKDMNCQEKYQSDGDTAMENQNNGELIRDHAEETGGEGNYNQCKQQPSFRSQFLSVSNGMDGTQQQKDHRCQLVDMYTGQRDHNSNKEADQQCDVQKFLHIATGSLVAGMVLTPQMK